MLAAILSMAYHDKAPPCFAYLLTITKASRTFESSAWATYDMAYRRQAANKGPLDWEIVDAALNSKAFAGRAKAILCCRYCLADTHTSHDYSHVLPEALDSHPPNPRGGPSRLTRPGFPLLQYQLSSYNYFTIETVINSKEKRGNQLL